MIRYTAFCKIVALGSFTRAAEVLGYTQAAISQMVRSLEAELKLTLLNRTRSGIRLTPEGELIYPYIQKTVACERALADKAREIYDLGAGEIRIGTFSSISGMSFAPTRFSMAWSTLKEYVTGGLRTFTVSPSLTSLLGLTLVPLMLTCPFLQAAVAMERVF